MLRVNQLRGFGRRRALIAASSISFKSVNGSTSNSVTIPTHDENDIIIICASEDGSGTVPTMPGDFTLIGSNSGNSLGYIIGYKFAAGSSETSGTWSGSDKLAVVVYSGVNLSDPIGGINSTAQANDTTAIINAVTLENSDDTSWVVAFIASRDSSQTIPTPNLMTSRIVSTILPPTYKVADTGGTVTSFAQRSVTVDSHRWKTRAFELKVAT